MSFVKTSRRVQLVAVLTIAALTASACSSSPQNAAPDAELPTEDAPAADDVASGQDSPVPLGELASFDGEFGALEIRLGEGSRPDDTRGQASLQVVDGEPLDSSATDALFERLPPLPDNEADSASFERPVESLPAPSTRTPTETPFPATGSEAAPTPSPGPLEVLRFQPQGAVGVAPFVSVTFNQPMVPLATLEQLSAEDVPVRLSPDIDGTWMWIGTRTLRFEADPTQYDRLPQATSFEVEIPEGTTAADGTRLNEAVRWEFTTRPVEIRSLLPEGNRILDREPVFIARFNQEVDQADALGTVTMTAAGERIEVRLASGAEIDDDPTATSAVSGAADGEYLAFRAVDPLPVDAAILVQVGPEVPSAEGPRLGDHERIVELRTYGSMVVKATRCSNSCRPGEPITIEFSNPVDGEFSPDSIEVTPAIDDLVISARGNNVVLQGATTPQTQYTIKVSSEVTDVFGQSLAESESKITVGNYRPIFYGPSGNLVTLDPFADSAAMTFTSVGQTSLNVRIYSVTADDWIDFFGWRQRYFRGFQGRTAIPAAPWEEVMSIEVPIDAGSNDLAKTVVDLSEALPNGIGHIVIVAEPARRVGGSPPTVVWAQATNIGADAIVDGRDVTAWATDLTTGQPLEGVEVEFFQARNQNFRSVGNADPTDSDGVTEFPLSGVSAAHLLIARQGEDSAILSGGFWRNSERADALVWYVIDDRGIYRPNETVNIKAWTRTLTNRGDAQLTLLDQGRLSYTVNDSRGSEIDTGSLDVNALGGFDLKIDLPPGTNLGTAYITFRLDGSTYDHSFEVQEFRRPEFEVVTRTATSGPYFVNGSATVTAEASYFSGGPLPDAPVEWFVTTRSATYAPPGWSEFSFGTWTPWWRASDALGHYSSPGFPRDFFEEPPEPFTGITDSAGQHQLEIGFDSDDTIEPITVTARANVFDVNRQAWSSETSVLVHPSELYVGLQVNRTWSRQGDEIEVSAVVTSIDGEIAPGVTIAVEFNRITWGFVNGVWEQITTDGETCAVVSGTESVSCSFTPEIGGRYELRATVADDQGRVNVARMTRWVSGGRARISDRAQLEDVTIIPDQAEYEPGDTAELLVEAPFADGTALVTVVRNTVVSTETIKLDGTSTIVQIPILDEYIPNLAVRIDVVGAVSEPTSRVAFASGDIQLSVPPLARTLNVQIDPADAAVEPGTSTEVSLRVTGPDGAPVQGSEVAVIVVDEAVLALTDYKLLNPLRVFYRDRDTRLDATHGRSRIELARDVGVDDDTIYLTSGTALAGFDSVDEIQFATAASRSSFAGNQPSNTSGAIDLRSNFDALALFSPELTTDSNGEVTVDIDIPDNLTRYRVMVVAVDGADRFGKGEENITASLPLMVRPSFPRFLNFGDEVELPVVVQNQTNVDLEIDVGLRATNLDIDDAGRRVVVPAHDRVEVRFVASTTTAGTARYQVVVSDGQLADAAIGELPIYTPATTEAFAVYGTLDEGATAQNILAPTGVYSEFGQLEIATSSTAVQALTDAVDYVLNYPYERADASASLVLSVVSLDGTLDVFDLPDSPDPAALRSAVQTNINWLISNQRADGGWGGWRRQSPADAWTSVQTTHALIAAKQAGYSVPQTSIDVALNFLGRMPALYELQFADATRYRILAYALYVRSLAGQAGLDAQAEALWDRYGPDSLEAAARLWMVVGDTSPIGSQIERLLSNRANEAAGTASFTTVAGAQDGWVVLRSDRRTDAIILEALIDQAPTNQLIPKVAAGLLGNQASGRWRNLAVNTYVIIAMSTYFEEYESQTPDFTARVWLGDIYAAEHEYEGRSSDAQSTGVSVAELIDQGDSRLVIEKDGTGRLYYRLGLTYAPVDLSLGALDRGFVVQRSYEAVDDPSDVTRNADGSWTIRAGAEVRVTLTMVADSRKSNVALVDNLPAGLEAVNPTLAVSIDAPQVATQRETSWWSWTWYDHQQLRDDRVEAFADRLGAGVHEYSYIARATTPGTFVVPPARAEVTDAPEVFGRSASTIVTIR